MRVIVAEVVARDSGRRPMVHQLAACGRMLLASWLCHPDMVAWVALGHFDDLPPLKMQRDREG